MESPGKTSDEKSKSCDADSAKKSLNEYDANVQDIIKLQEHVIATQHKIISSGSFLGGLLSLSEKNAIKSEVNQAKQIFNLKIRENKRKDISEVVNPLLFQQLLVDIKNACPTITAVLELLVLTNNTSQNVLKTENVKMKATVHLLASMIDIRDQHGNNDFPLLFGLLCLCYGAGPSLIRMLQCLGLSESFPMLIPRLRAMQLNKKWTSCQERNLLRKMDLALNVYPETVEQIQSSSSDHLREMSDSAESKVNQRVDAKQFKINIPQIEEDFPDLATKKTKIFPLPISHENQHTKISARKSAHDSIKDVNKELDKRFNSVFGILRDIASTKAQDMETSSTSKPSNVARKLNINVGDQKNTLLVQGCANRCPDVYMDATHLNKCPPD
ncbi:Hypothetical predicted protein [Paramuricea clavata]|uniref:Uncharacterized protein n=1 Tax=Paramuricea clavata TaxID=317549 RepID=A0A6S7H8E0_PARCT|nr:Hypothetical predicted protein [Paramuricea clavata]